MSGERLETSRFFSNWLVQNKGASSESKISFLSHIHVRRAFADLKYVHYRTHCVWTCRKETWTCRAATLYEFLLHFLLVPAGVDTTMRKYRMLVDSPKVSQPHLSVSIYLYMQCFLVAAPATGRMKTAPCKARLYVRARHVPKWSRGTCHGWKKDLGVKG